ncbi:MAG: alpha/beta hydrolase [Anaerolineae bacterium]|nr:alpha/beta hydrolase [Anaerolineae bacterium]
MKRTVRTLGLIALLLVIVALLAPYLLPLPAGIDPAALADPEGAFVEVDDLQVADLRAYYTAAGPEDGPPVLLLHGLGGSTFSWRENMAALAATGYRAIALDRPGFGLTDKPLDYDYGHAAQADFVAAFMDVLGIDRAVLVGHSAGGSVIAHTAARHPDRVRALVYVDGAVGSTDGRPEWVGGLVAFPPLTRWVQVLAPVIITPERFNGLLASAYGPDFDVTPEVEAGYARVLQTEDWQNGFVGLVRDAGGNTLSQETIAALEVPTLITWGELDTWIPLAQGEALRALLPGAVWRTYPDAGHLPMEEAPEAFNRDLIAFLDGLPEQP